MAGHVVGGDGAEAVSYTHLDVYKRQGLFCKSNPTGNKAERINPVPSHPIENARTVFRPVSYTHLDVYKRQLLENTAARFPDTDAVIHADRELRQTWSEFSACVDDMARGLMAIGVQKGEKVAVWATRCV